MATINGTAGNDNLFGTASADLINGLAGSDTMTGGNGNDTYYIDNVGDSVVELSGEGTDLVNSFVTYVLEANVDNLLLNGTGTVNGTGNTLNNSMTGNSANNILTGNDGNDTLNGGTGADTMIGGVGDDIYFVDNAGDVVTESVGEGVDTVNSTISYILGADIDRLVLTGSSDINATGNTSANRLTGNSGSNILDGGAGNDVMLGGLGDDYYYVDSTSDVITENSGEGLERVYSTASYTLSANVEKLFLQGVANINGTGNSGRNSLYDNAGNNVLTAGAGDDILNAQQGGDDTLVGGSGSDIYYVDSASDVITELSTEGTDVVYSTAASYTLSDNVEKLFAANGAGLSLIGNTMNNLLTGNTGNDILFGGAGNDTMDGGLGDDTLVGGANGDDVYYVDSTNDVIQENASSGTDKVYATVSYTLSANVESLILSGSANIDGAGNGSDNFLTGNAGDNVLAGGAGNDNLTGGFGNDTLSGDSGRDTLTGGAGNDTYLFGSSDGLDYVIDTSGSDAMLLATGVSYDQLWFTQVGSELEVSIIGTTDKTIIKGWYSSVNNHVEQIETTDGGHILLDSAVDALVAVMAGFTPPPFGTTTLASPAYDTVLAQITASWS